MVGKIDDHRVAPSEVTENARQHGIVVAGRVVIVGHDLSLHPVEIRAVVVFGAEVGLFRRKAAVVFHVLPPKMQQIEISTSRRVVFEQMGDGAIVATAEAIAEIEAKTVEMRIVEKERTVEVDGSLRHALVKLVGDKSHLEAGAAKQQGEEHPVGPSARLVGTVRRQKGFERATGEVPRRDHVVKHDQLPVSAQAVELRRGRFAVAIEAGVVFVVTLSDHHHKVRRPRCHAVHTCRVHDRFEHFDLALRHAHQVQRLEQAVVRGEEVSFGHPLGISALAVGHKLPQGLLFLPPVGGGGHYERHGHRSRSATEAARRHGGGGLWRGGRR